MLWLKLSDGKSSYNIKRLIVRLLSPRATQQIRKIGGRSVAALSHRCYHSCLISTIFQNFLHFTRILSFSTIFRAGLCFIRVPHKLLNPYVSGFRPSSVRSVRNLYRKNRRPSHVFLAFFVFSRSVSSFRTPSVPESRRKFLSKRVRVRFSL